MKQICIGRFDFEEYEGLCIAEFHSRVGMLTAVFDAAAHPPFRLYGPDGMEVDPKTTARGPEGEFAAYDLTRFLPDRVPRA